MERILTSNQRKIVEELQGLCTVRACPGSGKTWTISVRLCRLLSNWNLSTKGTATLSFTNVAWQEIQRYLPAHIAAQASSFPHFLGSIDHFINKYIFLPFGHLVTGFSGRPTLTGPPHDDAEPIGKWLWWRQPMCNQKGCLLNDFTYDRDGKFTHVRYQKRGADCQHNQNHPCVGFKQQFNQAGYATQSDANYFAFRILAEYPIIAAALARRFPVMMVDECQDTSTLQMAILELLVANGLNHLMLIGDPDQAIYEWRQAEPKVFLDKCNDWSCNSVQLVENWRSSQKICSLASILSSSETDMVAVNPAVADSETVPQVWGYCQTSDLPALKTRFIELCNQTGIALDGAHILTRGKELLNTIEPGSTDSYEIDPWIDRFSKAVARARNLCDRSEWASAFSILSRYLAAHILSSAAPITAQRYREVIDKTGFANWRAEVWSLLKALPVFHGSLQEWIASGNEVLSSFAITHDYRLEIKRNSSKCRYSDLTCEQVLGQSSTSSHRQGPEMATVFAVKGRTLDAVMLVLKRKGASGAFYVRSLGSSLLTNEELRIVYVGITRPRRLLVLVVPIDDVDEWKSQLRLT